MKKGILLLFFSVMGNSGLAQDSYFYDLQGMEDDFGITHLFYRIYDEQSSTCAAYDPETDEYYQVDTIYRDRNIYHFDTWSESDSLMIRNYSGQDNFCELTGVVTKDIEFFEAHPDSFITYSVYAGFEANAVITDFKEINLYLGLIPPLPHVTYDPGKDHFIFGFNAFINFFASVTVPRNSELLQEDYPDINEIPDSLVLPFFVYAIDQKSSGYIAQKEDSLFIYDETVSTLLSTDFTTGYERSWDFNTFEDTKLIYASNRASYDYREFRTLLRIERESEASIDTIRSGQYFEYAIDPLDSRTVIVSDSLELQASLDYGNSFDLLATFDTEITGLYKKPGSDLLYVLTKEELFEVSMITGESISLKQLAVSNEPVVNTIPATIKLYQNYPNPFNPTTTIRFTLPEQSEVSLVVYDMLGREVAQLVDELLPAGEQTVRFDASNLANGIYVYRLQANQHERVRMMTLIK